MERLTLNFNLPTPKKHQSERGELIEFFTQKLNEERLPPFKPLTVRAVAVKLGHLKKLDDLYYLKSYCLGAKNFSKCFWWSLRSRKNEL